MPKGSGVTHRRAHCEADAPIIVALYERVVDLETTLNSLTLAAEFWRSPTEAEFRRQQRAVAAARAHLSVDTTRTP